MNVRVEWGRRVHAEYRSAALTQHLTLWLIQLALSPDLVELGLRIVKDELAHARASHRVFTAAGGGTLPDLPRESLALAHDPREPLELRVTRAAVEVFCLGETVAVPLFKVLRDNAEVPVARRALDRVLRDEARHRDFGWTLLDALLETPFQAAVRGLVGRELPTWLARVRRAYGAAAGSPRTLPENDTRWGLMAPSRYATLLERTVQRDYVPRFARRGFDAGAAWAAAQAP